MKVKWETIDPGPPRRIDLGKGDAITLLNDTITRMASTKKCYAIAKFRKADWFCFTDEQRAEVDVELLTKLREETARANSTD